MTTIYNDNVTGMILAGGKARRMGGVDKGLISINGQTMIQYVLDVLKPQVHEVIINANRNIQEYEKLGCTVVSDQLEDYQGPLAGFCSHHEHCKNKIYLHMSMRWTASGQRPSTSIIFCF